MGSKSTLESQNPQSDQSKPECTHLWWTFGGLVQLCLLLPFCNQAFEEQPVDFILFTDSLFCFEE